MDQQEPTFEESIKQVMQTLPPVIRDYLAEGRYTPVAKNLMAKYGLRIDQAGILEREIMLLLMGIENPDEFTQALLEEAKLDQKTINGIAQDVNDQIFVPLRKEEETQSRAAPEQQPMEPGIPKVAPKIQQPMPMTPVPSPIPVTAEPARPPFLQNKVTPPLPVGVAPLLPKSMLPQPQPLDAASLLEEHEEPHIEVPEVESQTPPNLPGAMPPVAAEIRPPFVVTPRVEPVAPVVPAIPIKSYTTDPYREPVDEPVDEMRGGV